MSEFSAIEQAFERTLEHPLEHPFALTFEEAFQVFERGFEVLQMRWWYLLWYPLWEWAITVLNTAPLLQKRELETRTKRLQ